MLKNLRDPSDARNAMMALLPTSWPLLMQAPRGDGHPVLVIPGFMASDFSTRPLRRLLKLLGHDVHAWGQGRNLGASPELADRLMAFLNELTEEGGEEPAGTDASPPSPPQAA